MGISTGLTSLQIEQSETRVREARLAPPAPPESPFAHLADHRAEKLATDARYVFVAMGSVVQAEIWLADLPLEWRLHSFGSAGGDFVIALERVVE